ncbi:ATP-dependent zinc metalloprotease FtsH [Winogradskyella thalassocola]|uniref:ATP-dependent zinc metalloprotease FtsH n=1 Tax=Winogradskyella thalassocola TaxID=262004 RepID=A0A1G8JE48_9FLAO|nr:ATP-dependent zinc metalloprotease FtsH [Winogradskyella thalassocola]SDI29549.1 cell division protease FtsH [Winogradskyella thalassocola]
MATNKNSDKNNKLPKRFNPYWIYALLLLFIITTFFFNPTSTAKEISWLQFEQNILKEQDVEKIVILNKEIAEIYIKQEKLEDDEDQSISKNIITGETRPQYYIQIGAVESFENKLENAQQHYTSEEKIEIKYESSLNWLDTFLWILPFALILVFWLLIIKRMGAGGVGGKMFNFGKSTAKLSNIDKKSKVTFQDVAGLKEAKIEMMEILDFLKNPENYTKLGAKIPKGILLVGPPGTGKTLLARAIAGEARVPFFSMSGSEFVEMFVGVGASRVRDLFKQAKEKAPSIVFIDEIDAVGRSRDKINAFQSNDERENTLNQLLAELDGFGTNTGVIVLAATNRADILDKALLRAGRFDRHIYLELPTKEERIEIFNVHLKPIKKEDNVDVALLASLTPGFSGADIANICNEAALIAARKKKKKVDQEDFNQARDRIVGGLERKSKIISAKEKEIVAHHEAGHAVASWYLKHVEALVKVSIIPRGKSLGAAWYLPEERQIVTKSQFMDQMCAALGGRAAEEIIFHEISSGALDDLEKVTKQAYNMVAYFGLDEEVGPISFYDSTGLYDRILGKPYSENLGKLIDTEVQNLITTQYKRVKEILTTHKNELQELAQLLLVKEVADKDDLEKILGKRKENNMLFKTSKLKVT